jgi:DNA/RNA endonuclease YhcR with UshA esterase domain
VRTFITAVASVMTICISAASFAESTSISSIAKNSVDKEVTIAGKTSSFRPSTQPKAPNSFFVTDSTGQIRVAVWPDVFDQLKDQAAVKTEGSELEVKGKVAEFRGKLEIHVGNVADIKPKSTSTASNETSATKTVSTTSTATR